MNKPYSNPCVRCGKERIVKRTWQEEVGNSIITNKEWVCPDPKCQKEVEATNRHQQDRADEMRLRSEERAQARRAAKDAERTLKIKK